jgi:hypothetical protein
VPDGLGRLVQEGPMIEYHRFVRVLAHLMREEHVQPEAIERAIDSAIDMEPSQSASLDGDKPAPMRRAFLSEQAIRLDIEQ